MTREGMTFEEFCRQRHGRACLGQAPVPPEKEPPGVVPALDPSTDLGDLDDGEPPMFNI